MPETALSEDIGLDGRGGMSTSPIVPGIPAVLQTVSNPRIPSPIIPKRVPSGGGYPAPLAEHDPYNQSTEGQMQNNTYSGDNQPKQSRPTMLQRLVNAYRASQQKHRAKFTNNSHNLQTGRQIIGGHLGPTGKGSDIPPSSGSSIRNGGIVSSGVSSGVDGPVEPTSPIYRIIHRLDKLDAQMSNLEHLIGLLRRETAAERLRAANPLVASTGPLEQSSKIENNPVIQQELERSTGPLEQSSVQAVKERSTGSVEASSTTETKEASTGPLEQSSMTTSKLHYEIIKQAIVAKLRKFDNWRNDTRSRVEVELAVEAVVSEYSGTNSAAGIADWRVECDESNNPPSAVALSILNVSVYYALLGGKCYFFDVAVDFSVPNTMSISIKNEAVSRQ